MQPVKVPLVVLDKFTAPLRLFARRVNTATKPIEDFTQHMNRLHKATAGAFAALARPFKHFTSPIISSFRNVFSGVGGMVGIASVGAAAAGIFKITSATAEYADNLDKTSFKLGLTVEGLQKLRYAAKMSDIGVEEFDGSMTKLTQSIGAATTGDKRKAGLFASLGIDLKKSKDTQSVFLQIATALGKIKDASLRNTALKELFGKSGANMAEFFRGGRVEIEKLMAEREKYGLMGQKDIEKSKAFQTSWKQFTSQMEAVRNTLGMELMPGMTEGIKKLGDMVVKNMPQIKQFGKDLGAAFSGENIKNFIEYLQATGKLFNDLVLQPLLDVARLSKKAGEALADLTSKRQSLYVNNKTLGGITEKAPDLPSSNFGTGYGIPMSGDPYTQRVREIQRQKDMATASAAWRMPITQNTTHTNQAYLEIKVSPDGSVKTNMLGALGGGVNLGWSMVQ